MLQPYIASATALSDNVTKLSGKYVITFMENYGELRERVKSGKELT